MSRPRPVASGIATSERGIYALKGVPDDWGLTGHPVWRSALPRAMGYPSGIDGSRLGRSEALRRRATPACGMGASTPPTLRCKRSREEGLRAGGRSPKPPGYGHRSAA